MQRNLTTQNKSREQIKHNIGHRKRNMRTRMPHPPNQPTTITQTIQSKRTRELVLYNRRNHCNNISRGEICSHAITILKQNYLHFAV
jgi:hypothetical protein